MSTSNPNPYASPAAQPQASVMQQYPQSGVGVMQDFTPGQRGILRYRQGGGAPVRTAPGGTIAPPQSGAIMSSPQTMNTPMTSNANFSAPQTMDGMTNAGGVRVGAIRPPSMMQPNRIFRQ